MVRTLLSLMKLRFYSFPNFPDPFKNSRELVDILGSRMKKKILAGFLQFLIRIDIQEKERILSNLH